MSQRKSPPARTRVAKRSPALPEGYAEWLADLKQRIRQAQLRAVQSVNRELVLLYWQIGHDILERQQQQGWGAKVVDRLAADLRREFPDQKGFSPRNLNAMLAFARAWNEPGILQQLVAKLPWGHNVLLITKLKRPEARQWYAAKTIEHGWSRNVLAMQIETGLHERQGKTVNNFPDRLPPIQSDLAKGSLKDPYMFDFLGLAEDAQEREIETALTEHVTRFLLELGAGFAYMGRQVRLEVAGDEFFLDLLFYHTRLHCFMVVELKAGAFKPADAGQLNFYLSAVDAQIKSEADNPTIGLMLCRKQNRLVAEYALRDMAKPMGIAEFRLVKSVPKDLAAGLPTIEQIEAELANDAPDAGS